MLNPCNGCPRRAEYDEFDEYLDSTILAKPPVSSPPPKAKKKPKQVTKKKTKPRSSRGITHERIFKKTTRCKMGGCTRIAKVKGYCPSCNTMRSFHKKKGNPVPVELTARQIKQRARKGN